jgi:hypothetical protein
MSSSTSANPSRNAASPQRYQTPHAETAAATAIAPFARHWAAIQGKPASARLYLNKLLRPGSDASLAILTYHVDRDY